MAVSTIDNSGISASAAISTSKLGTGAVLQVVQTTYSTDTSTASTSFVDSGISATITPLFTSSKILVLYTTPTRRGQPDTSNGIVIVLLRNGSSILTPINYLAYQYPTTAYIQESYAINYLDSPASTSALTYKTQFRSINGGTVSLNHDTSYSSLTLMEIAG